MAVKVVGGAMVREAVAADDAAITALGIALYQEDPGDRPLTGADVAKTLGYLRAHPDAGQALVVERGGEVLGYAFVVRYWSNELGGLIAVLDELYVRPDVRDNGLGSAVIETLGAARLPGFEAIVAIDLEVTPSNHRARALYQRLGFRAQKNAGLRLRVGAR